MGAAEKMSALTIVERLDELPTLPKIVYELSRVINDPMSSTLEIEKVMSSDQSLTTKVLALANSAYYAIPGGVTSLQRAIAYIGYDTVNQLVLSASVINALKVDHSQSFDTTLFWKHSLGVAIASEVTARMVHHKLPSDLFTCGLIHDMGKIALFILAPGNFEETLAFAKANGVTLSDAESALDSPSHAILGRDLAIKWHLPGFLQAATAYHHQKDVSQRGGVSQEMNVVVDIVLIANLLIHAIQFGDSGHAKVTGAPREVLERLHLNSDKLKELIAKIKSSLVGADAFLKIIGGGAV